MQWNDSIATNKSFVIELGEKDKRQRRSQTGQYLKKKTNKQTNTFQASAIEEGDRINAARSAIVGKWNHHFSPPFPTHVPSQGFFV